MTSWRYNFLLHLLLPFVYLRLLWRGRTTPAYAQNIEQRFGGHKKLPQGGIVIHAVSLGETLASQPLVNALLTQYPNLPLIITNTTATGAERARALWGDKVHQCYLPYDYSWAMRRFLEHSRPKLIIVMETELWPNLIDQAKQLTIPVMLANGRLSAKSAAGYGKILSLVTPMLQALTVLAAQDQDTAQRFQDLGTPESTIQVTGSLKFDLTIPDDLTLRADELKQQWLLQTRPIWVAASTHEGEDEIVLTAFKQIKQQFNNALLILVPRHPERFDKVADLIAKQGLSIARRSQQQAITTEVSVFLGDSMGELLLWFALADVAFVGGSLVSVGGHNPLEPAALAVPIVTGMTMFNFKQITDILLQAGALQQAANSQELAGVVCDWLNNPEQKQQAGQAALQVVNANKGALAKHLAIVEGLLG
ncbi:MAG TPA: lipid IV(A) 3-deoxy-D-manno-octulosonic acid transferase [Agitococcus sp.]|nr:lipid IV(A) 3-deoxy-D-manno-octulosonic acid transferase [Agitococcus sp.]HMY28690.1 lipid IV(A) 3-deoxy-D-manno-octulosonic acid transferase [Agitococcus sp.]HMY81552.1 lipid IV(A) 3-deoxy-D-manno-octulosonic acid transferase [Agitococcus sp.]HNA20827.1 lipid IV(A) 3-deoxy-D-manno-octulosonic acid transferase [Agitococcus sp.]HNB19514.1 lipid IV(A) 3-deoxy-D-manno-octulosonic acid transferase [Agitococcus sp.]